MRKKSPVIFLDMKEEPCLSLPCQPFVILLRILEKSVELHVSVLPLILSSLFSHVRVVETAGYLGKHVKKSLVLSDRFSKDLAPWLE